MASGMKTPVLSQDAPAPIGPYNQAIRAGQWVFCSGQVGLVPGTGLLVEGGLEAEARQALDNLRAVLAAAGLTPAHVVKTTLYLLDMNDFVRVNAIYAEYFSETPPARATVAVAGLPKGARFEIEAIAMDG